MSHTMRVTTCTPMPATGGSSRAREGEAPSATALVRVIGAGPYGLSTAAHLKERDLSVRVFGCTRLARTAGYTRLEAGLRWSVPGLYFTGIQAAATFGPPTWFTCGTASAAPRLTAAPAAGEGQGR